MPIRHHPVSLKILAHDLGLDFPAMFSFRDIKDTLVI